MLPNTIWLITNYNCNNRCSFCYAAKACEIAQKENEIMDYTYACDVLKEMRACGTQHCLLIGGEPTLYPEIIELVKFGTSIGLAMKLVSNGRRLSDSTFVDSLKNAGLVHSSVSIEASTAELNGLITNKAHSFEQSIKGIVNLQNAKISNNTVLTISALNAAEIVQVAELMHKNGVLNILYNFSLPSVANDGDAIGDAHSLFPKEYADLISEAYLKLKLKKIHISFFATLPLCLIEENIRSQMMLDKTINRGYHCHVFYGTGAAFEPNGNVLPCTHFVDAPLFNAKGVDGKFAYEGKFADEWENGIHKDFIEKTWCYPAEKCESCELWGYCTGGCPFLWMHYDPQQYIK